MGIDTSRLSISVFQLTPFKLVLLLAGLESHKVFIVYIVLVDAAKKGGVRQGPLTMSRARVDSISRSGRLEYQQGLNTRRRVYGLAIHVATAKATRRSQMEDQVRLQCVQAPCRTISWLCHGKIWSSWGDAACRRKLTGAEEVRLIRSPVRPAGLGRSLDGRTKQGAAEQSGRLQGKREATNGFLFAFVIHFSGRRKAHDSIRQFN